MVEVKKKSNAIRNWLVFILALAVLTAIPVTRVAIIQILEIIGQLFFWFLLLFLVILALRWLIVRIR